jgi:hypothetical protein
MLKALFIRFMKGKWGTIIPYVFKAAAEGQFGPVVKKLYWVMSGYGTMTGMIFVGLGTAMEAISSAYPEEAWAPVAARWIFNVGTILAAVGLLRGGVNSPWPEGAQIEQNEFGVVRYKPQALASLQPTEIPVGDVLRTFVKRGFLRKILDALRGIRIGKGNVTIVLSENETPGLKKSQFDSKPANVEPPQRGRMP